jgi:hypothetical protein
LITQLRRSLTGRYRMLEREAAKTALDLNLANAEFQPRRVRSRLFAAAAAFPPRSPRRSSAAAGGR